MIRRFAALAVLVLLAVWPLKADVAPFPSWRLAANGAIMRALQAGPALYVAGNFTKIGRAVPAFAATLDPATLSFVPRTGCAQAGTSSLTGRYSTATTALVDAAGPYLVPAGTAVVRIGADCRFDRRFRVAAPPSGVFMPSGFVELNGRVYLNATTAPGFPVTEANSARWVIEVDGVTGALVRYWPVDRGNLFQVVGVTADGRLLAVAGAANFTSAAIGVFDTSTGQFVPSYTASGSWTLDHVGAVIVLTRSAGNERDLLALDGVTLTPLPNWPVVHGVGAVYASGGGRLVMSAQQVSVNGVAAPHLVAFDAVTGAQLGSFVAPPWLDDAATRVTSLAIANGRVIATGDFAPGAPRDAAAAFDATTGALDPWLLPYAVPTPSANGGLLYFPGIDARDRVARTAVAAVDAATGVPLPFTTAVSPTNVPYPSGRYALAADSAAGHLYVGWPGSVRRFDLATGQADPTWTFDTRNPTAGFNVISDIALLGPTVYVSGSFSQVRDDPASAWQSREGAAAITKAGVVTAWAPQVQGNCFISVRPVGVNFPCVSQMLSLPGRLVMSGTIARLQAPLEPTRAALSVAADTGADDGFVPVAPAGVVGSIATDASALFATARVPALSLVRIDDVSGARVVGPVAVSVSGALPGLAVHGGRAYADVERDLATAAATGNPMQWSQPVAAATGVLDIVNDRMALHVDAANVAPRPPENLSSAYDAATVRLQWSPGAGDLAPLESPPAPGGTAATSHVVLASLAPGGPPVAQIDTGSADTSFSITAPVGTFYVRVQAKNGFGTSAPSAELRVDVRPQAPNPPLATVASVSGRLVHIDWQAPPLGWPATSYLLEAGTAPGLTNLGSLPVIGTSFQASVPPGRYYVRIRAVNATGASVPGDEVILDVP